MKVVIPLAEGFEEIEFNTVFDILKRAGIDVVAAGLKEGLIEGKHKLKVMPDITIDEVNSADFDAVILPGGSPGFVNLGEDERVLKLVREMNEVGKYVSAICGAPSVLSKAGILEGRKATIYPGAEDDLIGAQYVDERVVVDGNIITSQAAGTAMEFAMKLVEIFLGEEKVKEVNATVFAKI